MKAFSIYAIGVTSAFFTLATGVHADTLGQSTTFRVNSFYDLQGATTISATVRGVGEHAYVYVDDRYWASLADDQKTVFQDRVTALTTEFDSTIYPKVVGFFGSEATPGVDADTHITVLLERLIGGNGGYFETIHNFSKDQVPDSNGREMVFVAADAVLNATAKNFLAHEFQHLISFSQKELMRHTEDDIWLNEARSEYAITVAGYSAPFVGSTLERRAYGFFRSPSDSLVEWPNTSSDYAIASVFMHYLADRYGPNIIAHTISSNLAGVEAIQQWLIQSGKSETFSDVFTDWMVAAYINDRAIDARYGYQTQGLTSLRIVPPESGRVTTTQRSIWNMQTKEYQPLWVAMALPASGTLPAALSVQITGQQDFVWQGASIANYSGHISVLPWQTGLDGTITLSIPTMKDGRPLWGVTLALTQAGSQRVGNRAINSYSVSVAASLGTADAVAVDQTKTPEATEPQFQVLQDGDLIRRQGQAEVYVIWGKYRRYLPQGVLELYGFQNRTVIAVPDDAFFRFTTSNYIRTDGDKKVYAVWPDGTKHWMNITATQWDGTGRDWGAIFTVNDRESGFYTTKEDITR